MLLQEVIYFSIFFAYPSTVPDFTNLWYPLLVILKFYLMNEVFLYKYTLLSMSSYLSIGDAYVGWAFTLMNKDWLWVGFNCLNFNLTQISWSRSQNTHLCTNLLFHFQIFYSFFLKYVSFKSINKYLCELFKIVKF